MPANRRDHPRATEFADACARFVREALLAIDASDEDAPASRAATSALARATEAASILEAMARAGTTDLTEAYVGASNALSDATLAFSQMRRRAR